MPAALERVRERVAVLSDRPRPRDEAGQVVHVDMPGIERVEHCFNGIDAFSDTSVNGSFTVTLGWHPAGHDGDAAKATLSSLGVAPPLRRSEGRHAASQASLTRAAAHAWKRQGHADGALGRGGMSRQ